MEDHIDRNFDDYSPPRPRSEDLIGPEPGALNLDWILETVVPGVSP